MSVPAAGATSFAAEPQALLAEIVEGVTRALPAAVRADALVVERSRSLGDRVAGREGRVTGVVLTTADESLSLRLLPGARWQTQVARVSGGIVIARRTPAPGEWLAELAGRVAELAAGAAGDAAAAARALEALGATSPGADVVVRDADVLADLRALPARVSGRVPAEALDVVGRVVDLLADTLPRVAHDVASEVVVRRTATVYLPDTLRAYLALPREWAARHVLADGTTIEGQLVTQLAALETAAAAMRDAALEDDATAVLVNGRFLADRFAG